MPRITALLVAAALVAPPAPAQHRVTTPRQALGFDVGADYHLATYTQLEAYWRTLVRESPRMVLREIGKTAEGRPQLMAIITAPENHKRLAHYEDIARRLALAQELTDEQAHALAREGKAAVWIDGGLHATEVLGAHQLLELVFQMVSRDDPETRRILDDVILLAVHANPDGMELVSSWYMRESDSLKRSTAGIPRLYQKYIGHDNNRDFYMVTQPETENMARVMFREWFPQIVYNHHQTGPAGTVLFAPPFRDPFNYYFDPLVPIGIDMVAAAMHERFLAEGKPGALDRAPAGHRGRQGGGAEGQRARHHPDCAHPGRPRAGEILRPVARSGAARPARLHSPVRPGGFPDRHQVREYPDQERRDGAAGGGGLRRGGPALSRAVLYRTGRPGVPPARPRHVRAAGPPQRLPVSRRAADPTVRQRGLDPGLSDGRELRSHPGPIRRIVRAGARHRDAAPGDGQPRGRGHRLPAESSRERRRDRHQSTARQGGGSRLAGAAGRGERPRLPGRHDLHSGHACEHPAGAGARDRPGPELRRARHASGSRAARSPRAHRAVGPLRGIDSVRLDPLVARAVRVSLRGRVPVDARRRQARRPLRRARLPRRRDPAERPGSAGRLLRAAAAARNDSRGVQESARARQRAEDRAAVAPVPHRRRHHHRDRQLDRPGPAHRAPAGESPGVGRQAPSPLQVLRARLAAPGTRRHDASAHLRHAGAGRCVLRQQSGVRPPPRRGRCRRAPIGVVRVGPPAAQWLGVGPTVSQGRRRGRRGADRRQGREAAAVRARDPESRAAARDLQALLQRHLPGPRPAGAAARGGNGITLTGRTG